MSRLSDLYKAMETLRKEGLSLNEDLERQVNELEEEIIKKEILPVVKETIEPAFQQVQRELVLVVDYRPGQPISVSLSRKTNINKLIDAKKLESDVKDHIEPFIKPKPEVNKVSEQVRRNYQNASSIMQQFVKYMRKIKHSESTISGYTNALLNHVTPYLHKKYDNNAPNIFSFTDPIEVRKIYNKLIYSSDFFNRNEDMHHEMSAAIKKYIKFLESR